MTANEMRETFKLLYNGATAVEMEYDDREVGMFLTLAQLDEVHIRMYPNRNPLGEGLEQSSKRDAELNELKQYVYILPNQTNKSKVYYLDGSLKEQLDDWSTGKYNNSKLITLPSDYLYNVQERVDITYNGTVTYTDVALQPINEDYIMEAIENPFHKPEVDRRIYRVIEPRKISARTDTTQSTLTPRRLTIIYGTNVTLDKYKVTYIRRPLDIVVDTITPTNQRHCELDASIHQAIVERAVSRALGAIGSQKYQVGINERDNLT